jgi:SSS family solute:Na+ symporter
MELHPIDIAIIALYLVSMIVVGFVVERRARGGIANYFLGSHEMPWWILSMSNAASMFDVSGTMWLVSLLYLYGLKSVFIPWLWPVFNQIFLMVYLSAWLRRSKAMTGAEWITLRFGQDRGAEASRISVVVFAIIGVIAFTGYAFVGIAKFSDAYLPNVLSANTYALIIIAITTLYTVVGGLYSVVITDLIQFFIKLICCLILGGLAMWKVSPTMLQAVVPAGWTDISFHWMLDLDWSHLLPAAEARIASDGYTMFGAFFMMVLAKGVLVSAAGPAPNYDMQRILAAKSPREAAMMSGLVTVVLFVPRYFMIAGITILALAFMGSDITHGAKFDFEQVLPIVIRDFLPFGLAGLLISGLLAAFMSNFSGTINAAAAYLVNDVYKRYMRPLASDREYIFASYVASILVVVIGCAAGIFTPSVHKATDWIVSALWSGYAAPNILKWHWWRFNGWGYFYGMIAGIAGALVLLLYPDVKPLDAFPLLMLISLLGAIGGSLLTAPENTEVLLDFYTRTRPWGWWTPIREIAQRRDPAFQPNRDFGFDAFNVAVGIIWQTSFVALPIYVVIRHWQEATICIATITVTSFILKRTWYDRLTQETGA